MIDKHARNITAAKWDAENTKQIKLKLNLRTDADILEHLDKQESRQGYIKALIRADIEKGEKKNMKNFKEQMEELFEKRASHNYKGESCLVFRTDLTDDDIRWIVEECPSWDYLDTADCSGVILADEAKARGILTDDMI